MRYIYLLCFSFIVLLSSGCSMHQPQSAEEFRQMLPGSMFGKHETFEVNRSLAKVTSSFKKRAGKCLNMVVERTTTNQYGQVMGRINTTYTPTVRAGKKKTELIVQQLPEGNVILLGEIPKKGMYFFVADAVKAGKKKTKIDFYRGSIGSDTLARAVKNWATGKNMGCPDLTQG